MGGDGSVLRTIKSLRYTYKVPVLGISTGLPGFFTEPKMHDADMIRILREEDYNLLEYRTIQTLAETEDGIHETDPAVNDVMIRCKGSRMIHLNLYVGDTLIEHFSGDGLLISTAAGSTAYNYSLGGSIVDQRLALLQVTPAASANNTVYRNFTSGIVLPGEQKIVIEPDDGETAMIVIDGTDYIYYNLKRITVSLSGRCVRIVRMRGYDFWNKVKTKYLSTTPTYG